LSIQKSAAKTCVAADSEISNKNYVASDLEISSQLCLCRFLKSATMVVSFQLYFSLFLGVCILPSKYKFHPRN